MSNEVSAIRSISWQDICPGGVLLEVFRLSISLPLLLVALVGVTLAPIGWRFSGALFLTDESSRDEEFQRVRIQFQAWPGQLMIATPSPDEAAGERRWDEMWAAMQQQPRLVPVLLSSPFVQLFRSATTWDQFLYCLVGGLWNILIWSFCGGAITRTAVVWIGRDERLSIRDSCDFARRKSASFVGAPLLPLAGVVVLALPLFLLGIVMRTDAGVVVAGLLWPAVAVGGLIMAILAVGLLFGWPLMLPTICAEGTDSFDAISRAYAYTLQRPLQYALYAVAAIVLGGLGWLAVWMLSESVVSLTLWGVRVGMGDGRFDQVIATIAGAAPDTASGTFRLGGGLLAFCIGAIRAASTAFCFSFFWVSASAIYLLMRLHVDRAEMDDVYVDDDAPAYGLPAFGTDDAGVAGADDADDAAAVEPARVEPE